MAAGGGPHKLGDESARRRRGVYRPLAPESALAHNISMDHADAELDARGLLCPLPVLKARKRLHALAPGAVLRVVADDPAAAIDLPHFCAEAGHALLSERAGEGAARVWLIRKGG
jgi:tRNA 2-thiouridine synthesizing protein A